MRRALPQLLLAIAATLFVAPHAFAQTEPVESATGAPAPSAPAPAPVAQPVAAAARRRDTVVEFVLYRGKFDAEDKQALFSDSDFDVVKAHKVDELRRALAAGYSRPTYSIGRRECSYPLSADGKRQANGSTCDESEVV